MRSSGDVRYARRPVLLRTRAMRTGIGAVLLMVAAASPVLAQTARVRYESAQVRERTARAALETSGSAAPLAQARRVVSAYEAVVRRFPTSGYADNALWQGAALAERIADVSARADDRALALRMYEWLAREYPTSRLTKRARQQATTLMGVSTPPPAPTSSAPTPPAAAPLRARMTTAPTETPPVVDIEPPALFPTSAAAADRPRLGSIQRTVLPESVRITLELDREASYREERISGPDRVFVDMKGVQVAPALADRVLTYSDDIVREIRVGRRPESTVRVVLNLEGVSRYSVFTLYNPFRLVVDLERTAPLAVRQPTVTVPLTNRDASAMATATPVPEIPAPRVSSPIVERPVERVPATPVSMVATAAAETVAPSPAAPAAPSTNTVGGFSIARQLGLSVSRIVIDPGHGGHDPGAHGPGLNESELTLDVALRLEKLLLKEPGVEVVLTRRTNVYIPLEERTAIANRESADLFLSIHANASRNPAARGVETYFLSFASSPDAEAVAARENSSSSRAMHNLPDIIKAIALNNKLDESRDLAGMVQESMVTQLRQTNKDARNLGVKKAPFVVLIGAAMPSVLAEISFLTHKPELQLLKTGPYKDRIAGALHAAVMKYRRSLKRQGTTADSGK